MRKMSPLKRRDKLVRMQNLFNDWLRRIPSEPYLLDMADTLSWCMLWYSDKCKYYECQQRLYACVKRQV